MLRGWIISFLLLAISCSSFLTNAQTPGDYRSAVVTGNWNASGSWEKYNGSWAAATDYPGQNAGAGTVTIRDGHAITLNVSPAYAVGALIVGEGASGSLTTNNVNRTITISSNLIITANGSYNLNRSIITVNGTTTINGSMTDGNNNGSAVFVGLVTIGNSGSFSTNNTSALTFRGGITNNGTFSQTGAGAITFDTNDQSIGGTQAIAMAGIVTVTGITVTNNCANLSLTNTGSNSLTGTGGTWKQGSGGALKFYGASMNISFVDFNTNNNTIDYSRGGAQTVFAATYKNLTLSTSGTKTLGGAITVNNNLDISGTAILDCGSNQITGNAAGMLSMASGTSLLLGDTATAADVLFPTSFTAAHLSLNSASSVTYQNNATQTVSSTPTYGNLIITKGGTKTLDGNLTVGGNLTISAGIFDLGTVAATVNVTGTTAVTGTLSFNGTTTKTVNLWGSLSGAGTIDMSGGSLLHKLNLGGPNNAITTFTTASVPSTVTYTASGNQQVFGSTNYRKLITAGSGTKTMQGTVTVNDTFTIGSGTSFDPAGNNITANGFSIFAGTLAESSTNGTNSFQNVDLSGGTINGTVTDVTNINGNLTMPTGDATIGRTTLTISGTTTIPSGRSLTINSNTGVKTFVGKITISGSGSWNSTTVTTTANLVLRGGFDVASASGSFTAGGATFNTTASQDISGAGPVIFNNTVSISGAINITNTNTAGVTFNGSLNGTVAGSTWTNGSNGIIYYQPSATTQPMNTGTLDASAAGNYFYYSRSGDQSIKAPSSSYYHLIITGGSSSTKTLTGATPVSANLQIGALTSLNATGQSLTVSGTTTIDGSLIDGSNSGTNTFTGLVTISASGSLSTANSSPFVFENGIVNYGTFNKTGTGAVSFNTNDQDIDGTEAIVMAGAVTIAAGKTVTFKNTHSGGITLSGVLNGADGSSTWKNNANTTTYYQPSALTEPMGTGVLDVSSTGVNFYYSRGANQNVKAITYYNLGTSGGAGAATLQGNVTVNGTLQIGAGTTLNPAAYDLTISGITTIDGAFIDNNNGGTNTFSSWVDITATGSLSTANSSNFIFEGGITNEGTFNKSGSGSVYFNTNDQNIDGTAAMTMAGAVTIASGKTLTYKNTSASGITLSGVLDGANTSSRWKSDVNTTVSYQPGVSTQPMNTGILDVSATGSIFAYTNTGAQAIKSPASAYCDLEMIGIGTRILSGPTVVNGNLTLNGVTLDVVAGQDYSLTVKGDFQNTGGVLLAQNGTVSLNGGSDQQITSDGITFYNLTIANTAAEVSLNDDLAVSNVLTLSDGVVTTGANSLIVTNTAFDAIAGYGPSGFINGNLRRYIDVLGNTDTYVFPVGNGTDAANYYQADLINHNLTGINYIDSRFKPLTGHNDDSLNVADYWEYGSLGYTSINTAGVWELEPDAVPSGGSYDVKLYINNMSGLTDNNFGPLKRPVGSTNGKDWTTGGGILNNDNSPGRLVSSGYMQRSGLTNFSEFGAGSGGVGGAGLPIELISFTAEVYGTAVINKWSTATEINNDYFTVERSKDGTGFEEVAVISGAGNSSVVNKYSVIDEIPYRGTSYYRLKQTDFDGGFTYSNIVSVVVDVYKEEVLMTINPNPSSGNQVFVKLNGSTNEAEAVLDILDTRGGSVYNEKINANSSGTLLLTLPEGLKKGIYLVAVKSFEKVWRQKLVIE